jgi:hypothetical protein
MIDLSGVVEQGGPVPDGTYSVMVDKAEVSPTKTGGEMIKVQLKVLDGACRGRVIFDQFNIKNANPQAVQIGLGQIKGMMKAFGHPNVNRLESSQELVGLKGTVRTKVEDSPGYASQARVKAYGALPASAVSAADPMGMPAAAPAAGPASNPFG